MLQAVRGVFSTGSRAQVEPVYQAIRQAMPEGYEESMDYGMISWSVPLETYPDTYNGRPLAYVALAAQKRYFALYLNNVYMDPVLERQLRDGFAAAGLKLDMGKSCLRFRGLEDLPLGVIGFSFGAVTVLRWITSGSVRVEGRVDVVAPRQDVGRYFLAGSDAKPGGEVRSIRPRSPSLSATRRRCTAASTLRQAPPSSCSRARAKVGRG